MILYRNLLKLFRRDGKKAKRHVKYKIARLVAGNQNQASVVLRYSLFLKVPITTIQYCFLVHDRSKEIRVSGILDSEYLQSVEY